MNWNRDKRNLEYILEKLPDWCTGKREVYEATCRARYGNLDCGETIHEEKVHILKAYFIVILIFLVILILFLGSIFFAQDKVLNVLSRPNYGEDAHRISVKAEVLHGKTSVTKKVTLRVLPQVLTEFQKKEFLKECKERLSIEILGKNKDLNHISHKLLLPKDDSQYPIRIKWSSNQPEFLEENGDVHRLLLNHPVQVALTAELSLQDFVEECVYKITLIPQEKSREVQEELSGVLQNISKDLSNNTFGEKLDLPDQLADEIFVKWYAETTIPIIPLIVMVGLILFFIYKRRYVWIEKELQNYRVSMQREYPDFINKVILLLNAGLVITTALERIAMDAKKEENRPLLEGIKEICHNVKETNSSFSKELRVFARRSGSRELMRFAAIVCDNLDKGSSLAEKLEAEGELLWMARKKAAEEEGRKAETKLILPLMVLLLILVVITVSPVLIEI